MRIENINQAQGSDPVKRAKLEKSTPAAAKRTGSKDSVALSSKAQELASTKARIDGIPEVRMERVIEAKKRVKEHYYDTPEVMDKIADKLIKDLSGPKI